MDQEPNVSAVSSCQSQPVADIPEEFSETEEEEVEPNSLRIRIVRRNNNQRRAS